MAKKIDWEKIRLEWETTKITFRKLAEKHSVKEGTLKSRRSREKWSRDATDKKDATKNKRDATSKDAPQKNKATSNGNRKGMGNPNPKNQFTKRNQAARKHGLFAKYLPDETLEIMEGVNDINPLDILWTNIQMQFASIIRAQQLMFVYDQNDIDRFVTKERDDELSTEKHYEIHTAWHRQATFMSSLSRSMAELRNMVKQYMELTTYDDDRLMEVERMQAIIAKTKAETERIESESDTGDNDEIVIVDEWTDD